ADREAAGLPERVQQSPGAGQRWRRRVARDVRRGLRRQVVPVLVRDRPLPRVWLGLLAAQDLRHVREPRTRPEAWQAGRVSDGGPATTDFVGSWLPLPDVATELGTDVGRVRQLVRERQVLAFRREGVLYIPAELLHDGRLLKGLPGVLTLLADGGYSDEEALGWLFTADDSLPGRPVD